MNKVMLFVAILTMSGCATNTVMHETCNPMTGDCYMWTGPTEDPQAEEKKDELNQPVSKEKQFKYPDNPYDSILMQRR